MNKTRLHLDFPPINPRSAMATQSKEHPVATLLSRAHSPSATADIYRSKIVKQPLLLRPSSPDAKLDAREQRRRLRQKKEAATCRLRKSTKPTPLSAKQKRALQVYTLPKEQRKYAVFEPLHHMWCSYIQEVLGLKGEQAARGRLLTPAGAGPMLASADFHGALLTVVRSRCVGRVGITGIVVKDTKFTFEIITIKDEIKTVPKEHTVFRFEVPVPGAQGDGETGTAGEAARSRPLVFEIYGSQFETRAPDRANKKFKMHIDPDL